LPVNGAKPRTELLIGVAAMVARHGLNLGNERAEAENRCDDHVRQHILSSLRNSGYWALSRLECDVNDGVVVLSGLVSSYFLKQVAQTLVLRHADIKILVNHIEVRAESANT
jgi:osmotically-inducible protein OsmY